MPSYTARMEHNKETITRLSVTQYSIFEFGKKLIRIVTALGLIIYGLYADQSMVTPMICLILGCMLIANFNLRAKVRAGKVIASMNGRFPFTRYRFSPTEILLDAGEGGDGEPQRIAYSSLIRLVEDEGYLYLYISRLSAYMIDKTTVAPDAASLKALIGKQTGFKWTRPTSFFNFSLRTLLASRRKPGRR